MTEQGALTTVHNFCSIGATQCTDGAVLDANLLESSDGNLYGTTLYGGPNTSPPFFQGVGTAFTLTPTGSLTTLYTFCSLISCTDDAYPSGGLIQGSDGNLYGTTSQGGANNLGTVFRLHPVGGTETVVPVD
jgi:uncharacterized repeat protein (TIGR03803 family)